ncbi:MAG: MFS transporter [Pseudomonadota bacterium]|nr:MFS transporter [Pseudomonadota bacterium]
MSKPPEPLSARAAVWLFLGFAFAYFFSALLRGVTATLAPQFSAELGLSAGDLGLLAGAFFLGFALTQLPLGTALDRYGPRQVLIAFLFAAVIGCGAFASAHSFLGLTLARTLIGVGVSACLMAPMTAFRHRFSPVAQLRANSWILMTGSLGMVASTLPVQWLLPFLGWRGLFWVVAGALALATLAIGRYVPHYDARTTGVVARTNSGYLEIVRHPTFQRFAPLGFSQYGGLIAVQSLWAGPWLVNVAGLTPADASRGLFAINVSMLVAFMAWGSAVPRLYARGWTAQRLLAVGVPLSLAALALALLLGPRAGAWNWALFCVMSTFGALSQPAVGQAFPAALAGRALSAYNLVIFSGVFVLQWGLGIAIDVFRGAGWSVVSAYRGAFALLGVCCTLSYLWFLWRDDGAASPRLNPAHRTADNPPPCPD